MHPSRLPGQVRGGGARIIPKPPLTGATLLRFPPAAGVGCRMLQAPRKSQQRQLGASGGGDRAQPGAGHGAPRASAGVVPGPRRVTLLGGLAAGVHGGTREGRVREDHVPDLGQGGPGLCCPDPRFCSLGDRVSQMGTRLVGSQPLSRPVQSRSPGASPTCVLPAPGFRRCAAAAGRCEPGASPGGARSPRAGAGVLGA